MKTYQAFLDGGDIATIQYNEETIVIEIEQFEKIIKTVDKKKLIQNLKYLARRWNIQPIKEHGYRYMLYYPFKYLAYFMEEPIFPDDNLLYIKTQDNHIILEGKKGITKDQVNGGGR